jgi:hypothetical protein
MWKAGNKAGTEKTLLMWNFRRRRGNGGRARTLYESSKHVGSSGGIFLLSSFPHLKPMPD